MKRIATLTPPAAALAAGAVLAAALVVRALKAPFVGPGFAHTVDR